MKKLLLLTIVILLIPMVLSIEVAQNHGIITTQTDTTSDPTGMRIVANVNTTIIHINKSLSNTATTAYVRTLDAENGTIGTATFIGVTATFATAVPLIAGNTYFLVTDVGGGSYTFTINSTGTQPNQTIVNWTARLAQDFGIAFIGMNSISGILVNDTSIFINSIAPTNNTIKLFGTNTTFNASVNSTTGLLNASLWFDGILNVSQDLTGTINTTEFSINLSLGTTIWYFQGCNTNGTCSSTENRTIQINNTIINSETFNVTSFESKPETFIINISADGTQTITAELFYFNRTYTSTKVGDNNEMTFTSSLDIPLGVNNNTFRWLIDFGGTNINTTEKGQDVDALLFNVCNATLSTPFLNFTFLDETNNSAVSATIPTSQFNFWLGEGTINKSLTYVQVAEQNLSYGFCSQPVDEPLNIDISTFQYNSEGYQQRTFDFSGTVTNTTTNQVLYLLQSGLFVLFQVVNPLGQTLEGVTVNATRVINGSDVLVSSGITDAAGGVTFFLNPDFLHTFNFDGRPVGSILLITSFAPTQSSYTITLTSTDTPSVDFLQGITYNIFPKVNSLVNDTTFSFNVTLNSAFSVVESFGYTIRNSTSNLAVVNATTNGGTLNSDIDTSNYTVIIMDFFWTINGTQSNVSKTWIIFTDSNTQWSINNFFIDLINYTTNSTLFGLDNFGLAMITFLFIFILTGVMSHKYGLTSATGISAFVFSLILFLDVGVGLMGTIGSQLLPHAITYFFGLIFVAIYIKEVTK